ncbi:MAG: hypothetical protein V3V08_17580 [Nannocystaceae bacterium]
MTEDHAIVLVAIGLVHLPFAVEVARQLVLQARLFHILPKTIRAEFPRHPRPALLWLGSPRFFCAYLRYLDQESPGESAEVRRLKRQLNASLKRHRVAAVIGLCLTGLLLLWATLPANVSNPTSQGLDRTNLRPGVTTDGARATCWSWRHERASDPTQRVVSVPT